MEYRLLGGSTWMHVSSEADYALRRFSLLGTSKITDTRREPQSGHLSRLSRRARGRHRPTPKPAS
jgi:hypothetical protein